MNAYGSIFWNIFIFVLIDEVGKIIFASNKLLAIEIDLKEV